MIYSRTAEYAIRALAYISSRLPGAFVGAREVSEQAGVPRAYIAKIFQALNGSGILVSAHGRSGGFMLKKPPARISLKEVISAVDKPRGPVSECVMGLARCDDKNPCPLHPLWTEASKKIDEQLEKTSLTEIVRIAGRFSAEKKSRQILSRRVRNVFC